LAGPILGTNETVVIDATTALSAWMMAVFSAVWPSSRSLSMWMFSANHIANVPQTATVPSLELSTTGDRREGTSRSLQR
jgi:hypothetical protein